VSRKRGAVAAYRWRSRAGGGAPKEVDGVPVVGVPEDGGGVARKLLRDDVVLLVLLVGLRSSIAPSQQRGRAAAELELAGVAGNDARVRESKIGWVSELQGVAVVL
jgi:hypothetical protein